MSSGPFDNEREIILDGVTLPEMEGENGQGMTLAPQSLEDLIKIALGGLNTVYLKRRVLKNLNLVVGGREIQGNYLDKSVLEFLGMIEQDQQSFMGIIKAAYDSKWSAMRVNAFVNLLNRYMTNIKRGGEESEYKFQLKLKNGSTMSIQVKGGQYNILEQKLQNIKLEDVEELTIEDISGVGYR